MEGTKMDSNILKQHLKKHALDYIFFVLGSFSIIFIAFFGEELTYAFIRWATIIIGSIFVLFTVVRFLSWFIKWALRRFAKMIAAYISSPDGVEVINYVLNNNRLMKEGYPHISMRIETIQNIFDTILQKTQQDTTVLSDLGRNVAKNFMSETWATMNNHVLGQALSSKESILKWLRMEKTAGWGFFEVSFNDMPNGKFRGNITVKNCFLAYKRKPTDQNHCVFLCGYMEEIITAMAGFSVNVEETQCGNQNNKETCWFSFEPK
jgi:predicted hydrocarbon binding protein